MTAPTHAIASLKAALRAKLLADADLGALIGAAVFDAPPRGASPPYVVLGDAEARENGTVEAGGVIIDLDLVAVTSERGTAAALTLASTIEKALGTPLGTLADHRLVALDVRRTLTRHDPETSLTRALLTCRAFTEPL